MMDRLIYSMRPLQAEQGNEFLAVLQKIISLTRNYISCKVVKIEIYRNSVDQGSKVQYSLYREETHGLKGFSPRMNVSLPCEL